MKPFLSIVIPAYNEEKRLPLALVDIDKRLSKVEYSYEILVVDDGSEDKTVEVAENFKKGIKNLRVLKNEKNYGKGFVVRQGMLESKGQWRLFTDADNSTSIDQFEKMFPFMKQGYEVIFGSRAVEGSELDPPQAWYKQMIGKLGNLFIQALVLPKIYDTQCGFKCFSEKAAEKIFRLAEVNGWAFDVEALVLAKAMDLQMKEIPIRWVNDPESRVDFTGYFKTLFEVIKIKWWISRDAYQISRSDKRFKF